MDRVENNESNWPQRVGFLAILGLVAGLVVYAIADAPESNNPELGYMAICFTVIASIVFGFVVERSRIVQAALFAAATATVCAFVVYWNTGPDKFIWDAFRMAAIFLAAGIATPFFQTWQHALTTISSAQKRFSLNQLDYRNLHDRVWNNAVLFGVGWMATFLFFLLFVLISQLFALIKIDILADILDEQWFYMPLLGACFGLAVGIMRDREKTLSTLQNIFRKIASFFTPILAVALVAFLCSLPFTGLAPQWEATSNTSGIIMAVAAAAALFINILIGDSPKDAAQSTLFQWTAKALIFTLLPLGLIAAYSISLRIGQYGLTPERLWGFVFVGVALVYAVTYLVMVTVKRADWMGHIRRANVKLAASLCVLAMFLALPIVNFGAISTRSQLAILNSGEVSPEKFDWAALQYDFGPSGRDAVNRLVKEGKSAAIKTAALNVQNSNNRWEVVNDKNIALKKLSFEEKLIILPQKVIIPEDLKSALLNQDACEAMGFEFGNRGCLIFYTPGAKNVVGIAENCGESILVHEYGKTKDCRLNAFQLLKKGNGWENVYNDNRSPEKYDTPQLRTLKPGAAEIRDVTRKQVFINGKPVGEAF
jgi:Domain of unknown function (DUF4153)